MTALEAYSLAKKIAISAVSGIANLSVNGTTLTIETNDGNTLDMVFPTPADGRGITKAEVNSDDHLIVTYDDGVVEDAGLIKGSDVQVTQLLNHGVKIAKIKSGNITTDIFAPKGGSGGGDFFVIDKIEDLPEDLTEDDRQVNFCIEDGNFYLWDGTKWSVISAKIKIRELTEEEYNALTTEEQMNGTIYFVTDEAGGGGSGSSELSSDMTVLKAVGGIAVGAQYPAGTSLEDILRDMLAPVLYPTLTNPSANISVSGSKVLETGASVNKTFTVTFNRGSINPAYGTSGYRSGAAVDYALNGGTAQSSGTFTETVSENNKDFQATVSYEAGEQPKDSSGANYKTPLAAGSVTTNKITYEFVDCLWANTSDDITTVTKQSVLAKSTGVKQFNYPATTEEYPEVFDVPASWTVTAVEVLNSLSNQWEAAEDQFSLSTITHKNAGNVDVDYVRYTCNLGMDIGDRSVRVKWN